MVLLVHDPDPAAAERLVELGVLRDVLLRVTQDVEEGEEDRQLHQEGQATRERVDLVLLVELHHLFVELLAVVLVLRLKRLISGCTRCIAIIERRLLGRERVEQQHDREREQDDRDAQVRDQRVEERPAASRWRRRSGRGRNPCGASLSRSSPAAPASTAGGTYVRFGALSGARRAGPGRARPRARGGSGPHAATASQEPRAAPWRSSASSAYAEHDGWNRQRGGSRRLITRQPRIGSISDAGRDASGALTGRAPARSRTSSRRSRARGRRTSS